ncbi:hypothetical protein TanjilG_16137 [Lupinus angustifolius]|uniref:Uncharacterized protein n=1 Tax=Lupinus angustifolius TaxID=3871 RepID=A0A1J7IRZ9_LUPAN|nr:PREDICTED: uncharacterized protein LOC109343250 [Lupinus angustifolius]OIW15531.1 hypothetical protein TanjilG_16137 [Lupinus angustifolius]
MAKVKEEKPKTTPTSPTQPASSSSSSYMLLLLQIMSKRITWVCIFVLVYGFLIKYSFNFIKSMVSLEWPALYAAVLVGTVFGVLSMVAALAVMVPMVLDTWIAIVVLMSFFGKPRWALVVEGRKITREILGVVMKVLLKEGNVVAAVFAVLGYFVLVGRNGGGEGVD